MDIRTYFRTPCVTLWGSCLCTCIAAARAGNTMLQQVFARAGQHLGLMVKTLCPYVSTVVVCLRCMVCFPILSQPIGHMHSVGAMCLIVCFLTRAWDVCGACLASAMPRTTPTGASTCWRSAVYGSLSTCLHQASSRCERETVGVVDTAVPLTLPLL